MRNKIIGIFAVVLICFQSAVYAEAAKPAIIRYGMKGDSVKSLQKSLIKAKLFNGKADGVFDEKTLTAVKQFQHTVNLPPDGLVGPKTLKALKEYKPSRNAAKERPKADKDKGAVLRLGMRGEEVKKVQEYLIKNNFLKGKPDGVFGYDTLTAVKEFQAAAKIPADGLIGRKTLDAMKSYKPPKKKGKPNAQLDKQTNSQPKVPTPPAQPKINIPMPDAGYPSHWRPITLEATAYTRYDEGCTDYTYRGTYLRRGLVAVDPDIIPLGTRLYVPDYGYATADDIGGAIQGYKIDLAMETLDEAFAYGRRHITAYIIE